ncbi:O-antigen ligase family protein [Halomicroarcula sp. GCM10025894]|uniref:O-antigen ligase family protein n=1 Tax=Halomicroarcula sp. GCM10025894 TaxID=3252673 RepID=UPI00361A2B3F
MIAVEKQIIFNRQLQMLTVILIFALISILWAKSTVRLIQLLKFQVLSWAAFGILVSTVRDRKQIKYWIGFLVFLPIFSIIIITAITLIYPPAGGPSIGYFRNFPFDSNINIHSITLLTAFPIATHYFYHGDTIYKRLVGVFILASGIIVILLSGSRSPFLVLGFYLVGLAILNHKQIGWQQSQTVARAALTLSISFMPIILLFEPSIFGRLVERSVLELTYLIQGDLSEPGPVRSRIYITVWYIISEPHNLLTGVGFNNFGTVYAEYSGQNYYPNPHNPIFKLLTELGVLGAIFITLIISFPLIWTYKGLLQIGNRVRASEFASIGWVYVLLLCFGIFQPLLSRHQFFISSALVFSLYRLSGSEPGQEDGD